MKEEQTPPTRRTRRRLLQDLVAGATAVVAGSSGLLRSAEADGPVFDLIDKYPEMSEIDPGKVPHTLVEDINSFLRQAQPVKDDNGDYIRDDNGQIIYTLKLALADHYHVEDLAINMSVLAGKPTNLEIINQDYDLAYNEHSNKKIELNFINAMNEVLADYGITNFRVIPAHDNDPLSFSEMPELDGIPPAIYLSNVQLAFVTKQGLTRSIATQGKRPGKVIVEHYPDTALSFIKPNQTGTGANMVWDIVVNGMEPENVEVTESLVKAGCGHPEAVRELAEKVIFDAFRIRYRKEEYARTAPQEEDINTWDRGDFDTGDVPQEYTVTDEYAHEAAVSMLQLIMSRLDDLHPEISGTQENPYGEPQVFSANARKGSGDIMKAVRERKGNAASTAPSTAPSTATTYVEKLKNAERKPDTGYGLTCRDINGGNVL